MSKLYLKLHPTKLAWLIDSKTYGVVDINTNLIETGHLMHQQLGKLNYEFDEIITEKPFLKILGDNTRKLADSIIHVQRTFGVLLYILELLFPGVPVNQISAKVAREKVYKRESITKDTQLSEANVLLRPPPPSAPNSTLTSHRHCRWIRLEGGAVTKMLQCYKCYTKNIYTLPTIKYIIAF